MFVLWYFTFPWNWVGFSEVCALWTLSTVGAQCIYILQVVLLDECSQMTEPVALQPIKRAVCERLILVGDPRVSHICVRVSTPRWPISLMETPEKLSFGSRGCWVIYCSLASRTNSGHLVTSWLSRGPRELSLPPPPFAKFYFAV